MSFLSTVGKDFKAVFAWLGTSKGQATVQAVEGTTEVVATAFGVGAPVDAAFKLINNWGAEALKVETLATAAGQQTGTGAQKAAAVLNTMVPELTTYLQGQGLTSAQITEKATAINTSVVALLNLLEAPATTTPETNA